MKLVLVLVEGHPAAGKTATCKVLATHPSISHFSLGDALREIKNTPDHPHQQIVQQHMVKDELAPVEVVDPIITKAIEKAEADKATILLMDGYPRNLAQAEALCDKHQPSMLLHFRCEEAQAAQRYLSRAREPQDDESRFKTRYDEYLKNYDPPYSLLTARGAKFRMIHTSEATIEKAAEVVIKVLIYEKLMEPGAQQSVGAMG